MLNTVNMYLKMQSIFIICLKNNVLNIISAHCVRGLLFEVRSLAKILGCLEYKNKKSFFRLFFDDFYLLV